MSAVEWCRDDVLTVEQVAERLQADDVRIIYRMNLPRRRVGKESRYIWGEVLDSLPRVGASSKPAASSSPSRRGTIHEFRQRRGVQ